MRTCNTEQIINGTPQFCGKPAPWRHPRYPTGAFCDDCRNYLVRYFPNNWTAEHFAITLVPLEYVDEIVPAGTLCEKIDADERDKSSATRGMHSAGDGRQLIRISGRTRLAPETALRPARPDEFPISHSNRRPSKGRVSE
jgi:hypothetical protein